MRQTFIRLLVASTLTALVTGCVLPPEHYGDAPHHPQTIYGRGTIYSEPDRNDERAWRAHERREREREAREQQARRAEMLRERERLQWERERDQQRAQAQREREREREHQRAQAQREREQAQRERARQEQRERQQRQERADGHQRGRDDDRGGDRHTDGQNPPERRSDRGLLQQNWGR